MSGRRAPRYVPDRGDAVWLAVDSPAVVISPRSYNSRSGLFVACPITTSVKGYPFEVQLIVGGPVSGVVLADQPRTFDWRARNASKIASLPRGTMDEVLGKLSTMLSPAAPASALHE